VIGRLRGQVLADEATGAVVLDVHGVGYELSTPVGTLGRARETGSVEVELWVHTHVREEALGLLSALSVEDLARAVERSDHVRLGKVPGIGKKTAERLVLELKEKLRGLESAAPAPSAESLGNEATRLLSALVNMGYRPSEAERAVSALGPKLETEPLGDLLRQALAKLTP
jgi:Holliday junction DNA helicase RuvA